MCKTVLLVVLCALAAGCGAPYTQLPMTQTQGMAQAEDALQRGQYANAVTGFSDYLATGQKTFRARAFFELAQAQYGLGNYSAALDTRADMEDQFPNERWPQTAALRGDIDYALGKRPDAIRQWDIACERGTDADRQYLHARIETTVDEITSAEAAQLANEVQSDDVRAILRARVPAAALAASGSAATVHAKAAPSSLSPPVPVPPPPPPPANAPPPANGPPPETESPAAEEAANLGTLPPSNLNIAAGDALDPGARIAALLPLTGPDRAEGQRALSGLRLAFSEFPAMLIVRDTEGQPDLAPQLVTALSSDPTIIAFIGPLRHSTASIVAPLAERLQVPTLLLMHDDEITGTYVLQTDTARQEKMRALADYAVQTLGLVRLGILYPDDPTGFSYSNAFRDAATAAGATVVKSSPYGSAQQSFAAQTQTVQDWVASDNVQAVFIPDAAQTAVKVAAAARQGAPQIQLLGTESWNEPDVLASAAPLVDGAIFADSFFIGAGTPSRADLVSKFNAKSGHDPSGLEVRAYDAGMLVREAIAQGARSRGAVLQFLHGVSGSQGAGAFTSGALSPDLVLLQVRDGRVVTISR